MIALITLVIPVGGSAGPFNLYSNTDGYTTPFATNVSAAILQAGYTSNVVPNGTTTIRVISAGICTNSIDIPVNVLPTTSTTSTSTTIAQECYVYNLTAAINNASWTAQLCYGGSTSGVLPFAGNTFTTPCIINTSLSLNGITAVETSFDCSTTTTTSSSSTSTSTSTSTTTSSSSTTTTTTTTPDIAPGVALTWTANNGPFTSIVFEIFRRRSSVITTVSQKSLNNGSFPDPSGNYNGGAGSTFYSSGNPFATDAQLSVEGYYPFSIPSGLQPGDEISILLTTTNISSSGNGGPVGADVQSTLILRRTLRTVSSYTAIDTQTDSGPSPVTAYIPIPSGTWYAVDPSMYIYEVIATTEIA